MTKPFRVLLACAIMHAALLSSAGAVAPDEMLKDPALEARAREIGQTLRCVVCQNQSIDDSNAPLAKDLRVLVRERLTAGDSDSQAIDFIVARYGNFVLLKPPFQINTLLLWFGPAALIFLAMLTLMRTLQAHARAPLPDAAAELSGDDEKRVALLLRDGAWRPIQAAPEGRR
jgi:cytochrome c-type biogenesis protein CcmH